MRVVTDVNMGDGLKLSRRKKNRLSDFLREGNSSALNVRRIVLLVIVGVLAPVVQEALFNSIRIFGVKPNLAFVFAVTFSIVMNERDALFVGLAEGLYIDIVYGKVLGLYGLIFTVFCFLLSTACRGKFKTEPLLSLAVSPVVFFVFTLTESFAARIVTVVSASGAQLYSDFAEHMLVRILPVTFYDFIIFALLLYPMRLLWRVAAVSLKKKVAYDRRYDDDGADD